MLAQQDVVGVGRQHQFVQVEHGVVHLHQDRIVGRGLAAQDQVARRLLAFGQHALLAHQLFHLGGQGVRHVVAAGLDAGVGRQLVQRFGQHLLLEAPLHLPYHHHRIRHVAGAAGKEQRAVAQRLQRRGRLLARQHHHEQRGELQRHRLAAIHHHHAGEEGDQHDDAAQQPRHRRTQAHQQRHHGTQQHAGHHLVELVAQRTRHVHQAGAQRAHRHRHRGRQVGDGKGQAGEGDNAGRDPQAGVEIMTEEEGARSEGIVHGFRVLAVLTWSAPPEMMS